jgi:hypothetical protein
MWQLQYLHAHVVLNDNFCQVTLSIVLWQLNAVVIKIFMILTLCPKKVKRM